MLLIQPFSRGRFALPIERAALGQWFFPLAAIFALHALPVANRFEFPATFRLNLAVFKMILNSFGGLLD